ncbi:MAG: GxxExxY protein [Sarcina sp.]
MRRFNTAGLCIPRKHYMVDISGKLDEIKKLVEEDFYFVINRPRQFGKTTTLSALSNRLKEKYTVIKLSFEGLGEEAFLDSKSFCNNLLRLFKRYLKYDKELISQFTEVNSMTDLGEFIIELTENRDVILIIDEVDKISNNRVFLDFLGVLRSLYLEREEGIVTTFKSVILAGIYDIKNLKIKVRDLTETRYNSPWNIAVTFDVNMSFSIEEIKTMLEDYDSEHRILEDKEEISKYIYKFTKGYPFLVTRICQIIDEEILVKEKRDWKIADVNKAIKILLSESNTLFDDLIKNLENNKELYEYIKEILINNVVKVFNIDNPIVNMGYILGYLIKDEEGYVDIANLILKERTYNYMISKVDNKAMSKYNFKENFLTNDGGLNMKLILLRFQQFMKENYSTKDNKFLEDNGRLLFLAFIKPIINGVGFDYKEVQISEEKRLDIVIQYNSHKYILELKIWYGEKYHNEGKMQLKNYLDIEAVDLGYLLIFNFNKNKEFLVNEYSIENKKIFEVIV